MLEALYSPYISAGMIIKKDVIIQMTKNTTGTFTKKKETNNLDDWYIEL